MMVKASSVARVLGGKPVLKRAVRTLDDLERLVAGGLPVLALERAASYVAGSRSEAGKLRDRIIAPATRKRRKTRLKPTESERVERLARVMAAAEEVWDDRAAAREFLATSHAMLGGKRPIDVAQTELGARRVEQLLWELEHGLPV